jgi:putative endonuclease
LHQNWRYKYKELDLIFLCGCTVVFVEVKYVTHDYYIKGYENISKRKIANILIGSDAYLKKYKLGPKWRIDVISIFQNYKKLEIEHFTDVLND